MFTEICEAIEKRLQDKLPAENIEIMDFKIRKNPDTGYAQPGIYIYIDEGAGQRTTDITDRQTPVVNVVIKLKHLKREDERRKAIYPILEGVIGILSRQTLLQADGKTPIGVRPLEYVSFRNITLPEETAAGFILFLIQFKVAYSITKMDDEQAGDLLSMGIKYYLQPNNNIPAATDILTIQEEI